MKMMHGRNVLAKVGPTYCQGMTPNKVSLTWVLSEFGQSGASEFGKIVHRYIGDMSFFLYAQTTTLAYKLLASPN